jgi:replicative DNA helicase
VTRKRAAADFAPHDIEAEEALLGALLAAPDMLHGVRAMLAASDFYLLSHATIYRALCRALDDHGAYDTLTIAALVPDLPGGADKLNALAAAVPTAIHAPIYAALVKRKALRRALVDAAQEVVRLANDDEADTESVLDRAQAAVFAVGASERRGGVVTFDNVLSDVFDDIRKERDGEPSTLRMSTPWAALNKLVGGFEGKQLIIPAARPGCGKSAMMLQVATHAARQGLRVLMCSLEMGERELLSRIIAQDMGVPTELQRSMNDAQWGQFVAWVANRAPALSGISFETGGGLTPLRIAALARDLRRQGKLDVLIVDYLQLMRADGRADNRNNELATITRGLKELAMELDIPVIAASQLNRESVKAGVRPRLHNLRDSGALEADANIVVFIHDPAPPEGAEDGMADGEKEFVVAKNRNGRTGAIRVVWMGARVMFGDLARV